MRGKGIFFLNWIIVFLFWGNMSNDIIMDENIWKLEYLLY